MLLYRTRRGWALLDDGRWTLLGSMDLGRLLAAPDFHAALGEATSGGRAATVDLDHDLLPPIDRQEVWAAGVTYHRSRDARIEESTAQGGADFYDRVYHADRPELFFKATPRRVSGHGGEIRMRWDSRWNVPEPELTLVVNARGVIVGCTCGNDVSSRDIEGENPLYLPQAKVYNQSCALGPGIRLVKGELPDRTGIRLEVLRQGRVACAGQTTLASMKRRPLELVHYLFRDNDHPEGVFLMTGTGIVPDPDFTLEPGDEVTVHVDGVGALTNRVMRVEPEGSAPWS